EYLRISVTDRCNFRCVYCMPERGLDWIPRDDILSASEIHELVSQLAPLGLRRIRITGGEPTLRRDVCDIVSRIASVDGVTDIALSTNGVRLEAMGTELRAAGITRVNISVVVRGMNDDEIASLARLTLDLPVHVRFIELMPVGDMSDSEFERVVPSDEVLAAVHDALGGILPDIGPALGNGPARYYRAP